MAVFEPVQIEGTTVSRASLCNLTEIERLGVGKECTLSVIKANKIIPKCIAVKDAVGAVEIPKECPVCHHPTRIFVSKNSGVRTLYQSGLHSQECEKVFKICQQKRNGYRWTFSTDDAKIYK